MTGQGTMAGRSSVDLPWVTHLSPRHMPAVLLYKRVWSRPRKVQLSPFLDHSGASGSLVRNDDQRWKVGLDEEGAGGKGGP